MPVRRKKRANKVKASEVTLDPKSSEAQEIAGKTTEAPETGENTAAGFPIVGIGASAGGLAAFEAFYYRHYEKVYRARVEGQLSAIAALKVNNLVFDARELLQT